jgi:hypothetical protein
LTAALSPPTSTGTVDFNLHGAVGIRLCNATAADAAAIARQLGPIAAPLTRAPDIVIEFVPKLEPRGPLRYLGVDDAAYSDDAFFVLRAKHKARTMVQIPFAQIGGSGGPCHIVCEHGLPAVPLLIPILNLTALARGVLPLHAAAFRYQGVGVLATGWSKGGKTETLLAFMAEGAEYIGDEWVYISPDGCMHGIPEPIRLWRWHLQSLPAYWSRLGRADKARLHGLHLLTRSLDRTAQSRLVGRTPAAKQLRRVATLSKQQLHVDLPPAALFGSHAAGGPVPLEKVIFVASHAGPATIVQPVAGAEIAERMVFSLQQERQNFLAFYQKFRFAFPAADNPLIDRAEEVERSLLLRALAHKDAYALYHPYPVALPALYAAVQPLLR